MMDGVNFRSRRIHIGARNGLVLSIVVFALTFSCVPASSESIGQDTQQLINDYPTVARADYVFGCMAANGQTRNVLEQCACSIDLIASIFPYEKYVQAETVLRMTQVSGEKTAIFKTSPALQEIVAAMRRAQAEAEIRCF